MTTGQSPDEWWESLDPSRKASVQRWLSSQSSHSAPEIPGQTSIADFVTTEDEIDQPIPYSLTTRTG